MAAGSMPKGLADRLADQRGPVSWALLLGACAAAVAVAFAQSWVQGGLAFATCSGFILGFQLWAGSRSDTAAWRLPLPAEKAIAALRSFVAPGRARQRRRSVGRLLAEPGLSTAAKLEVVDLLAGGRGHGNVADLLRWGQHPHVPPVVRLEIAGVAARNRDPEGVRLLRDLAENHDAPFEVRFDAAAELLAYDECTAERCLETLSRGADTPHRIRLEAASIRSR